MDQRSRVITAVVIVMVLFIIGQWYIRYQQRPDVVYSTPTASEQAALNSGGTGQLLKYQITRRLPPGSIIKVWVEAYESGVRVDDIVACEAQLSSSRNGVAFYMLHLHGENGVTVSIEGFPNASSHGLYPVDEWAQTGSGSGGSGVGGNLYDGTMILESISYGIDKAWIDERNLMTKLHRDPALLQQFIADTDFVYLLKVQAICPGK